MEERRISSLYAKMEGRATKTLSEEFILDEGIRLKKKELTIDLTDRGSDWAIIHYNGRFYVKCCGKDCNEPPVAVSSRHCLREQKKEYGKIGGLCKRHLILTEGGLSM